MGIKEFAGAPPLGLDLTESRTASNNAIGVVLFILSLVFVALRLFVRLRMKREPLGLDDYLMFLGLALNADYFAYVFIYAWSVCVIKFSILALYRRIFGLSWLGYCCVGITTGYLITNHIVLPLYTRPISFYWNQWYNAKGVVLVDEAKFYLGVGIINLFGDICILAVPISNVMKLQMERSQKIAICLVFLLGSFVCFASLYRIITITRLVQTLDISWAKSDVFIWSSVEPSIGIISGCLPTLRPLLVHIVDPWRKYIPSSKKSSSTGTGSRPYVLNTIETISKKRTRKISKRDELESMQFTQLEDEADLKVDGTVVGTRDERSPKNYGNSHSKNWRPDDDELCLTTTSIHRSQSTAGGTAGENKSIHSVDRDGITMTRKFEWDEATRR